LLLFITRRNPVTAWTGKLIWKTNLFDAEEVKKLLQDVGFKTVKELKLSSRWSNYIMLVEAEAAEVFPIL
jgi:hypothetical protein